MMSIEIKDTIKILNNVRKTSFTECDTKAHYVKTFADVVSLANGQKVPMTISFNVDYTITFPDFHVDNHNGKYLHCDLDGKMCLFNKDAVMIKPNMLPQLIVDCYDRAIDILSLDSMSDEYKREYAREFCAYWHEVAESDRVYCDVDTSKIKFSIKELLKTSSALILSENRVSTKILAEEYLKIPCSAQEMFCPVHLIRLKNGASLPRIKAKYNKKEVIDYILRNLSSSNRKRFSKLLNQMSEKLLIRFILIYPYEYNDIVFGFALYTKNKRKKAIKNSLNCEVYPLYIHRLDRGYLDSRIGDTADLNGKKVLLLGCGSIGGFLANNLCQLGIICLDILDKDTYMPENACRHFLGVAGIKSTGSRFKADLVKGRLYELYPYVDIDSLNYVDRSVETFIKNPDNLRRYDLIISALGDTTLNLEINRILYEKKIDVPFLCCFNEPYGIGGHAILVNVSKDSCLQCLYTDSYYDEVVSFRGSLVKEGQTFIKTISGCGGSFVPYGCLDSQQTAILAARMAGDILSGRLLRNTFNSWIGNSNLFTDSGYLVSDRYKQQSVGDLISEERFENCNCLICSRGK